MKQKFTWLRRLTAILMVLLLIAASGCGSVESLLGSTESAGNYVSSTAAITKESSTEKEITSKNTVEEKTNATEENKTQETTSEKNGISVEKDGTYTDKEHVALYLDTYHELPSNYITKDEAEDLGWQSSKGNLWDVAPGKSIGGSYFGNYEKLLPTKKGRKYYECDIDFDGKYRNAKRIIYSSDGLVYYTGDHYQTFTLLYGEE